MLGKEVASAREGRATDPLIGRTLAGRYRISALLGQGGMSRVYEATQAPLGRAVALKVLRNDPADQTLQRRFLVEASVTSRLTHPNTITIFDYGADQGLLFFAMELLRGSTVSAVLKREGRLSEARTLHIARQVCRSLREAHAKGLVHRDLKPSNLFLVENADEADFVKVLDFGLVKVFGAEDLSGQLTGSGLALGTPHFMAPEQARGLPCDRRSDVYALGVVLFQMLAGRVPYDGPSSVDVHLRHATEPVPLLRAVRPEISAQTEAVVAKCMAKKPDDRYRGMDELLAALPGDRSGPTPALRLEDDDPGSIPLDADSMSVSAATPATHHTPRRVSGRHPVAVRAAKPNRRAAIGVSFCLVAGAVVWLLSSRRSEPAPAPPPVIAQPAPAPKTELPPPPPPPPPAQHEEPTPPKRVAHAAAPAKRAKATARASPEVVEGLNERLGRAVAGIRQCAMLASRSGGASADGGTLRLTVVVESSGDAADVALAGVPLGEKLETCIRAAVRRVRFDRFEGAPVTLARSVSLTPQ